jgi:hypothetical protein
MLLVPRQKKEIPRIVGFDAPLNFDATIAPERADSRRGRLGSGQLASTKSVRLRA